ncbi:hypothetical protein Pla163_10800 [Planctomycetes bacterium Pla163]|uniref:Uncharacterized protein n=1 Tax=Rohdeia mirabilis TaxID=2528008 RepID=A0A518CXM5_9BACT|nr:hypothetical protein Pla163_10800 [Planctomycetes bacterium Pla163]
MYRDLKSLFAAPLVLAALTPIAAAQTSGPQDTLCVTVKIELQQQVMLTKQGFEARFGVSNGSSSLVEGIDVQLEIWEVGGGDASDRFLGLDLPVLEGDLVDVGGSGILAPGYSGAAEWLIVPTPEAAVGGQATQYEVFGTFTRFEGGALITTALAPVEIRVEPVPALELDYYWQRTVYGDFPLTPAIEEVEPYSIGLIVTNVGDGIAKDVRIATSDLEIVENVNGLVLEPQLIAAELNGGPIQANLDVAFGDIAGGERSIARWLATSSLTGSFIEFETTLQHTTALNGLEIGAVEAVRVHPLVHVLEVGGPDSDPLEDDGRPDFLVDEESTPNPIDPILDIPMTNVPSRLDTSTGASFPVAYATAASVSGVPTTANLNVTVAVDHSAPGWHYLRLEDPAAGGFELQQVVRTGNGTARKSMLVGRSGDISPCWTTVRFEDLEGVRAPNIPDWKRTLVHIVDDVSVAGSYTYTLTYAQTASSVVFDTNSIDRALGGSQTIEFDLGPAFAGAPLLVLGTATGTSPSFPVVLGGASLPLVPDAYTALLLQGPAFLVGGPLGFLDAQGRATRTIALGPLSQLDDTVLHHIFIAFDGSGNAVHVSPAVPLFLHD